MDPEIARFWVELEDEPASVRFMDVLNGVVRLNLVTQSKILVPFLHLREYLISQSKKHDWEPFTEFVKVWAWLQARHQILSSEFPVFLCQEYFRDYPCLAPVSSGPGLDVWLSLRRNPGLDTKLFADFSPDTQLVFENTFHSMNSLIKLDSERQRSVDALWCLITNLNVSQGPALIPPQMIAFRDSIKQTFPSDANQADMAQDALLCTMASLLDLVPEFGRVTERIKVTGQDGDRVKLKQTQLLIMSVSHPGQTLQDVFDQYSQVIVSDPSLSGQSFHLQTSLSTKSEAVVVQLNQVDPNFIKLCPTIVFANRTWKVQSLLLLRAGHYLTSVRFPDEWRIFDDAQPASVGIHPNQIPEYLHSVSCQVRAMVLQTGPTINMSHVNLPNVGNSCYISSPVQMLVHCSNFMEELCREVKMSPEERRRRRLFPLQREIQL